MMVLWVGGWRFGSRVVAGPSWRHSGNQVSQQILEGAFLVGLVGDVRQVDPAKVGGMVQDYITHVEGEDIILKVLLQVRKEPVPYTNKSHETCGPQMSSWLTPLFLELVTSSLQQ